MAAAMWAINQREKKRKESVGVESSPGGSDQPVRRQKTFREKQRTWRHNLWEKDKSHSWCPKQQQVYDFYQSTHTQIFVAVLIGANFLVNVIQKEIDPYPEEYRRYRQLWQDLEDAFNVIFLIELILNWYGKWFFSFWNDGWNIFDFIIVTNGCLNLMRIETGVSFLRMLRAFRVFRLLKRVKSLNKIVVSLGKAVPGVSNAFVIMIILMAIYAMIAVDTYGEFGQDGTYTVPQIFWNGTQEHITNVSVSSITARGNSYGYEYYGSFSRAMYTLFQVMTGESWAEAVARPVVFGEDPAFAYFFFYSFIILMQIVMVNVVVAVLLEKMVEDDGSKDEEAAGGVESMETLASGEQSGAPDQWDCATGTRQYPEPSTDVAELSRELARVRDDVATVRTDLADMKQMHATLANAIDSLTAQLKRSGGLMPLEA